MNRLKKDTPGCCVSFLHFSEPYEKKNVNPFNKNAFL
jgi:hypothetical protein